LFVLRKEGADGAAIENATISHDDAAGITVYKAVSSLLVCETGDVLDNWNVYVAT
jgi:hypothetical protein